MRKTKLISQVLLIAVIVFLLAACGATKIEPQPGAAILADITTGDKANSGTLSFKVSDTGSAITDLRISLENANCQDMITMGSVMDFMSDPVITIAEGAFEGSLPAMGGMVSDYRFNPGETFPTPVLDPNTVGKITGRFTSATKASGTITIFLGAAMSGGVVCELGTFDWSSP